MHDAMFAGEPIFTPEIPFQMTPPDDQPRRGVVEWMPLEVVMRTTAAAVAAVVFVAGACAEAAVYAPDLRTAYYASKRAPFTSAPVPASMLARAKLVAHRYTARPHPENEEPLPDDEL